MCNLRDSNIHPSQRPYDAVDAIVHKSRRAQFSGDNTTNSNSPPSPTPSATDNNEGDDPDNTPASPDDTNDGGMSTMDKMLTPPDFDTNSQSKQLDVKVFRTQWQPHIRMGPFYPQPANPFKERKGAFNSRRNRINKRRRTSRNPTANNSGQSGDEDTNNDGDDEDDDGRDAVDPITPISVSPKTATHLDPPTTPRRVLRSRTIDSDPASPTPSPRTSAPQPKPKRKRDDSKTDPATPTQGQRVSKRQRNSPTNSPLPPMQTVKRTRAEQKKFESKFNDLIFDPERPGSVEREVVEIKSGAQEWKRASLHDEPWDGNRKSE
jgi:hypothetical protein